MRRSRCHSIVWASSWNTVLVVRPQPGQAVTSGRKRRRPRLWSSSRHTRTSMVRSPPGSGVRLARIVSPMPSCSRIARAAVVDTMPLLPIPASVRPRCSGYSQRAARSR